MKSKIDYDEINKLIELMEEKNIGHFELETDGFRISLGRETGTPKIPEFIPVAGAAPIPAAPDVPLEEQPQQEIRDDLKYITSPMVGTFYRAPDPTSPPFCETGDAVVKGQTLCIIEAMKLMNEIEAEVDGVIEEIFIKNGNPVEYGQKLFSIKLK